ncbi:hypothetical protein LSH36_303g03014 [Paralvinella palmiformis]|uniref:TRAPP14 C-terminal domain-containing protein n=1 Tax=Paralvinella palmiformis TaxID=53620 RepID=A0AAD9N342_9ANNE|nr:hypothetical protein LSH36_303g03014 [Paralvinella palmiformis]
MFDFCVCYPVQQVLKNLNTATLCTAPSLKYLISRQQYYAFVLATINDSESEAGRSDICDFSPQCRIVTHPEIEKTNSLCKCDAKLKYSYRGSSGTEVIISKNYPIQVSHQVEQHGSDVNRVDGEMSESIIYKDDRLFTVVHLPVLSSSLISADQNRILLKVQNVAYRTQVIESLDIFAHSGDANTTSGLTSRDDINTSCDILLSSLNDVFPLRLLTFEAYSVVIDIDWKNIKPGTSQEYDVVAQLTWNPEGHVEVMKRVDITWPLMSSVRLSTVEVRYPAFVMTASPSCKQPLIPHKKFSMQYTVDNKLQDLTNLKLVWSPEKAIVEKKALEDPAYRRNINNILNSVVCHQPVLEMGCCVQGTSTRVYIDFTILTPGLYELGQHMKLNIQPSVWSSPSKGNLHVITPPSSPYTAHQEPQNSINTSRTWNSSPQRVPQATMHSTLWYKDKNQPSERWNPLRSDVDARAAPKLTVVPKTLSSGGAKSPLTPGGAIIRRTEVLKRNCQVLVLDSST